MTAFADWREHRRWGLWLERERAATDPHNVLPPSERGFYNEPDPWIGKTRDEIIKEITDSLTPKDRQAWLPDRFRTRLRRAVGADKRPRAYCWWTRRAGPAPPMPGTAWTRDGARKAALAVRWASIYEQGLRRAERKIKGVRLP